jgi:hypothetical protein
MQFYGGSETTEAVAGFVYVCQPASYPALLPSVCIFWQKMQCPGFEPGTFRM